VKFSGDLDAVGARQVDEAFTNAVGRNGKVLVDLSSVGFMSSAGLAMLLVKGKMLRGGGGSLAVSGASQRVADVLAMAGFNDLFPVYPSLKAGLTALEKAS
jgi:anti-anti-sigma factor